jgi:glutaconyl-CoA/methylmalonyl-CoA decarboxylase subunit gamma
MRKYELKHNGNDYTVQLQSLSSDEAVMKVNGKEYTVAISAVSEVVPEGALESLKAASALTGSVNAPASKPRAVAASEGSVLAPIPGSIMEVFVSAGDVVKAGQPLFKMEAMKMENEINARLDGTIAAVAISAGDTVAQGDELMVITPS